MQFFYEHPSLPSIARRTHSLDFPTHLHQQPELYHLLEGTAIVTVDRETYRLEAGDLAVILPHRLHSYARVGETLAQLCIAELSLLGEYAPVLMRHACADPVVRAPDVHPDIPHSLEALSGPLPEPLAKAYLAVIFGRILENLALEPVQPQEEEDLLPRAMRYLQENIRETLSLERVACALSVSKYRLSRLFSSQVGLSFSAVVNALRVELAQSMLREARLPVTQVLYACGFESERTFYRAFQTHCHMTPRQFRQAAAPLTAPGDERQTGEEHA